MRKMTRRWGRRNDEMTTKGRQRFMAIMMKWGRQRSDDEDDGNKPMLKIGWWWEEEDNEETMVTEMIQGQQRDETNDEAMLMQTIHTDRCSPSLMPRVNTSLWGMSLPKRWLTYLPTTCTFWPDLQLLWMTDMNGMLFYFVLALFCAVPEITGLSGHSCTNGQMLCEAFKLKGSSWWIQSNIQNSNLSSIVSSFP